MKATTFPFTVERRDDQALVAMECGGLIRARLMPPDLLRAIVDTCRNIRDEVIPGAARDRRFRRRIPKFPDCIPVAHADIGGACTVRLVASTDDDGMIEYCAGFYDAEDTEAPALVLVNDQLQEFFDRAEPVLASFGMPDGSPLR